MKDIYKIFLFCNFLILSFSCQKSDNSIVETLPLPPSNLKIIDYTAVQVDLVWTDLSTNEKGYKIQRKQGNSIYADIGSVGPDVTNFIDKSVQPNTSYSYRVYSYNSAGQSITYSNEQTILTMTFDIKSGLIAYFPFTGNLNDSSGNSNKAFLENNSIILTTDRKNIINNAYLFSQQGSIRFTTPPILSIKTEVTISLWVFLSTPGGGCLLCNPSISYTSTSDNNFNLILSNNTLIGNLSSDRGGGGLVNQTGSTLNTSKWYHVAYTFDKSGLSSLYLDGVKISTNAGKPINDGEWYKDYYIGDSQFREASFKGKIDDLRLFNRALNSYEIMVLSKQ